MSTHLDGAPDGARLADLLASPPRVRLSESCSCGAVLEVDGDTLDRALAAVREWRSEHRHSSAARRSSEGGTAETAITEDDGLPTRGFRATAPT